MMGLPPNAYGRWKRRQPSGVVAPTVSIAGTVAHGQTLSATAVGATSLQWYAGAVAITGETGTTLTVDRADGGYFVGITCHATNGAGTTISNALAYSSAILTPAGVYDAADPNLVLVGSDIDQAPDLYGSGSALVAPASGNRPLLVAGSLNGQPVMRFAGGDYLRAPAFAWGGAVSAYTRWFVALVTTGGTTRYFADYVDGSARRTIAINTGADMYRAQRIDGAGATSTSPTLTTTTAKLWIDTWDDTTQSLYCNGTLEDSDANAIVALSDGGALSIGGTTTGTLSMIGDFAECGFVRRAITADEIADLNAYAAERYAL